MDHRRPSKGKRLELHEVLGLTRESLCAQARHDVQRVKRSWARSSAQLSREIRGFFLTTTDEAELSMRLRSVLPDVMFLHDDRGGTPREIASLSETTTIQVWILRRPRSAALQWDELPPLIQFLRCRIFVREGHERLRVGRMAIVFDEDASTRGVIDKVWKTFRSMCTNRLLAYNPSSHAKGRAVRDIGLGPHARRWHEGGGHLESNAANIYYTSLE